MKTEYFNERQRKQIRVTLFDFLMDLNGETKLDAKRTEMETMSEELSEELERSLIMSDTFAELRKRAGKK